MLLLLRQSVEPSTACLKMVVACSPAIESNFNALIKKYVENSPYICRIGVDLLGEAKCQTLNSLLDC